LKRVDALREQATLLRTLAQSFESPQIKEDLRLLAERCDKLAVGAAREISDRL